MNLVMVLVWCCYDCLKNSSLPRQAKSQTPGINPVLIWETKPLGLHPDQTPTWVDSRVSPSTLIVTSSASLHCQAFGQGWTRVSIDCASSGAWLMADGGMARLCRERAQWRTTKADVHLPWKIASQQTPSTTPKLCEGYERNPNWYWNLY